MSGSTRPVMVQGKCLQGYNLSWERCPVESASCQSIAHIPGTDPRPPWTCREQAALASLRVPLGTDDSSGLIVLPPELDITPFLLWSHLWPGRSKLLIHIQWGL